MKHRDLSLGRIKVKCEHLCELLDKKWPHSHCKALQQTTRMPPLIRGLNLLQHPLIRPIQALRKFVQLTPKTGSEAMPQHLQLTKHPSEPICAIVLRESIKESEAMPHIPSALSDSVSITSFFSGSRHFFILTSECTTALTYSAISIFCPGWS
jgi:hypothetical protein